MVKRYANRPYFSFLDDLNLDQDVKTRLSINLANIYSGNSDIYVTPLAKEHGVDRILQEWSKIFDGNRDLLNTPLIDLEESQKLKTGPRSISIPWSERWEQVRLYFEQTNLSYTSLDATPEAFRDKGRLRPLSVANAIKFLKNSTNSGLPYYTKKGTVKDRVLARFDELLLRQDPCILFTRTQEGNKTRDVWGYPMVDTLNEMRFYKPVLDYQKNLSWRSALKGPDYVNKKMTYIIDKAKSANLELISVDFSSYDRSIKQGLQLKCMEYYKFLFQSKYWDDLDYICLRKSTIGLVTPDGVMTGPHGEPSGSTFTNEDDSIAQFIISRESGATIDDLFDIQGDDGAYAIQPSNRDNLFDTFSRYGIEINKKKTFITKDYLVYLQNLYHEDYRNKGIINGIYPTFRALNRILFQERWSNFEDFGISGKDYYAIRTISILENCKHHPLFEKLVRFVLKYDKYGLLPSQKGIRDYVAMISENLGTEGILFNQYGDNIRGMNSFDTVKMIRRIKA